MWDQKDDNSDARLKSYAEKFGKLKERKLLKEIFEQEVLLTFIQLNMERIDEFPLLESEQNGLIKLMIHRSQDHPSQEHVRNWLNDFMISLNLYTKGGWADEAEADRIRTELLNAEKVLIQCVQGMVYAIGLAKDNIGAAVVSTFGAGAVPVLQEITKTTEPNETYWRAVIERFVSSRIDDGFAEIIKNKKYAFSRDDKLVVLKFHLEDIINPDNSPPVEVERTRIQQAFEDAGGGVDAGSPLGCVKEVLYKQKHEAYVEGIAPELMALAAQIVCIDPTAGNLCTMRQKRLNTPVRAEGQEEQTNPSPVEIEMFMEKQLVAMTMGAAIATDIFREDLMRAAKELSSSDLKAFRESVGNLERRKMLPALSLLIETFFCAYLRNKAEDDAGKLLFRTVKVKHVPRQLVLDLTDKGMNRIRQKKFFRDDPQMEDRLLFVPKTAAELQKLFTFFQLEQDLVREVLTLWRDAPNKVEVLVAVNLVQLAKVTTNLSTRVAGILGRFGIALG